MFKFRQNVLGYILGDIFSQTHLVTLLGILLPPYLGRVHACTWKVMSERLESILLLTENSILFFSIPKT
jgi:hypothetical protein